MHKDLFSTLPLVRQRVSASLHSLGTILAMLCLFSGLVGLVFLQQPIQEANLDIRQQASVENSAVVQLRSSDANSTLDEQATKNTLSIEILDQSADTQSVQALFTLVSDSLEELELAVSNKDYSITQSEIEKISGGYLFKVVAEKQTTDIEQNWQPFIEVSFVPKTATPILVSFDEENTFSQKNGNKESVIASTFTVATATAEKNDSTEAETETKPTPAPDAERVSPQPSPTMIVRPTPTPSPSPTPTPRVTPTPTTRSCNAACTAHSDCATNHLCFNTGSVKRCRLVSNPSSSSCAAAADTGLNRTCNQYCADSRECSSGLSCWFNRCRRPDNVESTSCSQLTVTQRDTINRSCNSSCTSNQQCALNMRCYNGSCRLASNPSSTSCSAVTVSTVSNTYTEPKGGSDIATSSASPTLSPTPVATLAPRPSVAPTTPVEIPGDETFMDTLKRMIGEKTNALALGLLGLGILLALLVLLTSRRGRSSKKPPIDGGTGHGTPAKPQPVVPVKTPASPLQSSGAPKAPPTPPQNKPLDFQVPPASTVTPQSRQIPIPPTYSSHMASQANSKPSPPAPAAAASPVVEPPEKSPGFNSMVERLAQKGVVAPQPTLQQAHGTSSMVERLQKKNVSLPPQNQT